LYDDSFSSCSLAEPPAEDEYGSALLAGPVLLVVIAVVACVGECECSMTSALVLLAPEGAMRVPNDEPTPAMPAAAAAAAAAASSAEPGFCSDMPLRLFSAVLLSQPLL
jgi:hypothetical protein